MRGIRIIIACTRMLAAILAPKEGRNNLQVAFAFPESMKILVLPGWDHLALHQYSALVLEENKKMCFFAVFQVKIISSYKHFQTCRKTKHLSHCYVNRL